MTARRILAVPVEHALVFTADRGWQVLVGPPGWWLDEQDELLAADERPRARLSLVPAPSEPRTPCRAGSGPRRRRHEHASARRVG